MEGVQHSASHPTGLHWQFVRKTGNVSQHRPNHDIYGWFERILYLDGGGGGWQEMWQRNPVVLQG